MKTKILLSLSAVLATFILLNGPVQGRARSLPQEKQPALKLSEAEVNRLIESVRVIVGDRPEATDEEMDAVMRSDR